MILNISCRRLTSGTSPAGFIQEIKSAATFLSRKLNLIYEVSLGQVGSGQAAADRIEMLRYENNHIGGIACHPAAAV